MTKEEHEAIDYAVSRISDELEGASDIHEDAEYIERLKERIRLLRQIEVDHAGLSCTHCQPRLPIRLENAREDVPWVREGSPGVPSREGDPWRKEVVNVSICANRLYTDSQLLKNGHGVAERVYAMLWDYEHNGTHTGGYLHHMLDKEPIRSLLRDEADILLAQHVAQAVIQWLGTNIGSSFLQQAEKLIEWHEKQLRMEREFLHRLTDCPTGKVPELPGPL